MGGIPQPPSVNDESLHKYRNARRKKHSTSELAEGILSGNTTLLSKAITLVESSLPEHSLLAQEVIDQCLPHAGKSIRIGITGIPGVGKSSFIESLGTILTGKGHKLAVLAIDPSSERSKGSILGDKTRMESLASNPAAFIRPSPSAGSLGGVARKTRESIILCEAAGYDTIFIETVGVGQSEIAVHSMVDFFLLLILPGSGDELQGIKRGIMEMADAIAITKADGSNQEKARVAAGEYAAALHLFPGSPSGWTPRVITCSARTVEGIPEIWTNIQQYISLTKGNDYFAQRRREQLRYWMHETILDNLRQNFYNDPIMRELLASYESHVLDNRVSPFQAAQRLLNAYYTKRKSS
jgi:LAO/AO transport system kinase